MFIFLEAGGALVLLFLYFFLSRNYFLGVKLGNEGGTFYYLSNKTFEALGLGRQKLFYFAETKTLLFCVTLQQLGVTSSAKAEEAQLSPLATTTNHIQPNNNNNISTTNTHQFFQKRSEVQPADPSKKWSEIVDTIDLNFTSYAQVQQALKTVYQRINQTQQQHKSIKFIQCRESICKTTEFDSKGGSGNVSSTTGVRRHYIQCRRKHSAEYIVSVIEDTAKRNINTATESILKWCNEFTKAAQAQHQQQITEKTNNNNKRIRQSSPTPDNDHSTDDIDLLLLSQDNHESDSVMLTSNSNKNNNFDINEIITLLKNQLEESRNQLEEQRKDKEELRKLNTALQKQLQELQHSFEQFREDITAQLKQNNNQHQTKRQQQQPEQSAKASDSRNDHSAQNDQSYAAIAKKRAIFKYVVPNSNSTRQKAMADCNKVVNQEYNTLDELIHAVHPKERRPSAEKCVPIYARIKLNQYALQAEYRIIKEISQKATGRHPYNIRSIFGGIYELAYDAQDVDECRQKLAAGNIEILQHVDIFAAPPTQPDKPREQTRKQVASSMGFALGRAYHPAVAAMYQQILSDAGEADIFQHVETYSKNVKAKYIRIARMGPTNNKKQQSDKKNNNEKKDKKNDKKKTDNNEEINEKNNTEKNNEINENTDKNSTIQTEINQADEAMHEDE